MNKDYASDIKQAQRFMFDNSIYLLNMFQKKIDSFISTKNKKQREKQLSLSRQQNNKIDPNAFFDDPIKGLARDLTKPIWNCVVKIDPIVFMDMNDSWNKAQNIDQIQQNCETNPVSAYRLIYSKMIQLFIHRYKTEHQDQSNLKINVINCQRQQDMTPNINIQQKQIVQSQKILTKQIFELMSQCILKQNEFLQSLPDLGQVQENYQYLRSTLQAYNEVIGGYLQQNEQKWENKQFDWFLTIAMHAIISILDSKNGATLITIQPKIGLINLLIHPLLIAVHNILSIQFKYNQKQKQQKDNNHNKHHNNNKQLYGMMMDEKKEQIGTKKNKIQHPQEGIQQQKQQGNSKKVVFQELKFTNCSRIAFINLDGYESQYNLDIVKYLSRYLMYVSFPKESFNRKQENQLKEFQHYKSERLLRKFFYQSLSEEQKKELLKLHQIDQKQFKKNMFILPVHSRSLCQKYQLLYDQNGGQHHSIQFYQSSFVKFMMEQVIMSHLRQYNPSLIILSYSGKINIQNQYFVQMIKQLTVISNFRLIFYPNLSKIFCFDQKGSQVIAGQDFFNLQKKYYQNYQLSKINIFHHSSKSLSSNNGINDFHSSLRFQNINLNFLDKLSIFLKVCSGTYSLSKTVEEDSYIQKYKNYKIMRYSALLLKNISKQYQTLQKLKMKANEYLTISKVLKNNYSNKSQTFDKLFDKVISKYHDTLIKVTQKLLFLDIDSINQINQVQNATIFSEQQILIIDSCKNMLLTIKNNFQYLQKKQIWQDFKFQLKLQLSTQKTENRFYLHIPKYKDKSFLNTTKSLEDLIVSVQFEIVQQKQKISVQLTSTTKILYTKKRPYRQALIYLINHIPKQKYNNYFSFYGTLNELIDQKSQAKIQLKQITFNKQRKMTQFQHYIDFNFYQTSKYVFLFWPKIFDDVQQKLYRILNQNYLPQPTLDIFRADRNQPGVFNQLKVTNLEDYQFINPRNGCTCYQPFQNVNRFYVFGGFYNKSQNYLNFQNDITFIDYKDENNQIQVRNVPKQFYLASQKCQQLGNDNYLVREFKNDFVRARIQFQVYEPDKQMDQANKKQVFLIGGIGQKFMRPFSLISYTGNKITFINDGNLQSIKRIKTNNLLPVNLSTPTKNRSPQQMNVVTNAQNRNIYLNQGLATQQSLVTSYYRYFYDHNQQRFDYEQVYQFADLQKKNYRQQTNILKRTPTQYPIKYELMANSYRGKQFYNNFIKVSSQNGKKYIFQLQLQLSVQVKNVFPNYQKLVRLTGASILAIDINASMLYCLIKHPSFTLDKCILAHYDINNLAGKLVDSKAVEIHLKQIHKFDIDVSRNIIVVANSGTVAVLHGYRFNQETEVPQMILKKYRKNQIKTFPVKQCQEKSAILTSQHLNKHVVNQISCSFFINQNSGIIICLTFKSIDRIKSQTKQGNSTEVVYLRIQKLDMTKQEYRWKLLNERIYKFQINHQVVVQSALQQEITQQPIIEGINKPNYIRLIEVKGNRQSKDKKQKQFSIKAIYKQQVYNSVINVDVPTDRLQFKNINQTQQNYYKSIYKQNIKQESIYLQKNPYFYQEMKQSLTQANYQSIKHISSEMNRMDLQDQSPK